jgi:hypothetical protein
MLANAPYHTFQARGSSAQALGETLFQLAEQPVLDCRKQLLLAVEPAVNCPDRHARARGDCPIDAKHQKLRSAPRLSLRPGSEPTAGVKSATVGTFRAAPSA